MSFYYDNYDYYWNVYVHFHSFEQFRLSETRWFSNYSPPGMFPPLDLLVEYWLGRVTIRLIHVKFVFSTKIIYNGVPRFKIDCLCGVWCHWLTKSFHYFSPLYGSLSLYIYIYKYIYIVAFCNTINNAEHKIVPFTSQIMFYVANVLVLSFFHRHNLDFFSANFNQPIYPNLPHDYVLLDSNKSHMSQSTSCIYSANFN